MSRNPIINTPPQGRTVAVVGDVYRFLATGEDTNGQYALFEALVGPGGGPPPHVHSREEEGFYILEGAITFTINGERVVATAGVTEKHEETGKMDWHLPKPAIGPNDCGPDTEPRRPQPEPIRLEPEPLRRESEPIQPEPEPLRRESEPIQPEPEPLRRESEPIQPEPEPLEGQATLPVSPKCFPSLLLDSSANPPIMASRTDVLRAARSARDTERYAPRSRQRCP